MSGDARATGLGPSLPLGHSLRLLKPNKRADEALGRIAAGQSAAPSSLLARLDAFLPQMKAANEQLAVRIATEGSEAVNIEAVDEDARHIAMDIAITDMAGCAGSDDSSSEDSDADADVDMSASGTAAGAGSAAARIMAEEVHMDDMAAACAMIAGTAEPAPADGAHNVQDGAHVPSSGNSSVGAGQLPASQRPLIKELD